MRKNLFIFLQSPAPALPHPPHLNLPFAGVTSDAGEHHPLSPFPFPSGQICIDAPIPPPAPTSPASSLARIALFSPSPSPPQPRPPPLDAPATGTAHPASPTRLAAPSNPREKILRLPPPRPAPYPHPNLPLAGVASDAGEHHPLSPFPFLFLLFPSSQICMDAPVPPPTPTSPASPPAPPIQPPPTPARWHHHRQPRDPYPTTTAGPAASLAIPLDLATTNPIPPPKTLKPYPKPETLARMEFTGEDDVPTDEAGVAGEEDGT
ncbi:hypothetical protein PAHAL_9G402400 [Panicum hallii]|uniref:Uncharacterized protein n=1 Tax=Panicum hallii TaxID=206008 RepID=A0A2S3IQ28_9POAL|nr:hypothetical protein PAHAL_9G402400 [Panicum hallii]